MTEFLQCYRFVADISYSSAASRSLYSSANIGELWQTNTKQIITFCTKWLPAPQPWHSYPILQKWTLCKKRYAAKLNSTQTYTSEYITCKVWLKACQSRESPWKVSTRTCRSWKTRNMRLTHLSLRTILRNVTNAQSRKNPSQTCHKVVTSTRRRRVASTTIHSWKPTVHICDSKNSASRRPSDSSTLSCNR